VAERDRRALSHGTLAEIRAGAVQQVIVGGESPEVVIRALVKWPRREQAVIYFQEESGIRSDYHSGTTWARRGRRRWWGRPALTSAATCCPRCRRTGNCASW